MTCLTTVGGAPSGLCPSPVATDVVVVFFHCKHVRLVKSALEYFLENRGLFTLSERKGERESEHSSPSGLVEDHKFGFLCGFIQLVELAEI